MLLLPPSFTIATIATCIATITTALTEHSPGWDRSTSCLEPRCSFAAAVCAFAAGGTCMHPRRIETPAARACTCSTQASGTYSPPGIISSDVQYTRHDDRHPLLSLLAVATMFMTDQYHHSHHYHYAHHYYLQLSSSSYRLIHLSVTRLSLFVTSWPTVAAGTPTRH